MKVKFCLNTAKVKHIIESTGNSACIIGFCTRRNRQYWASRSGRFTSFTNRGTVPIANYILYW